MGKEVGLLARAVLISIGKGAKKVKKIMHIMHIFMRPAQAWEVSLKRAQKMQLRNVDLRSVGHSNQKLSPKIDILGISP